MQEKLYLCSRFSIYCVMKKLCILFLTCLAVSAFAQQVSDSLYIGSSDKVANLIMSVEDYDNWIQKDGFNSEQLNEITNKLYAYFNDDFDMIMLISNEADKPSTIHYYGSNDPLGNNVKGIGRSIYSRAKKMGSAGKLFSVMHLPYVEAIKYGPTLHEFAHCWANFAIPTINGSHWGVCGGNTKGQLGGFKQSTLQTNVDGIPNKYSAESFGTFANGGNSVPYSDMELYLMGMIPVDSVQEFDAFPTVDYETLGYYDEEHTRLSFIADSVIHYTPESIVDSLGVRIPDFAHSQKTFKALFVVLSKAPLTEEEWTRSEEGIDWFCGTSDDGNRRLYNFWEATRGRGSIDPSHLSRSLKSLSDNE